MFTAQLTIGLATLGVCLECVPILTEYDFLHYHLSILHQDPCLVTCWWYSVDNRSSVPCLANRPRNSRCFLIGYPDSICLSLHSCGPWCSYNIPWDDSGYAWCLQPLIPLLSLSSSYLTWTKGSVMPPPIYFFRIVHNWNDAPDLCPIYTPALRHYCPDGLPAHFDAARNVLIH